MEALRESNAYAVFAGQILKSKWVKPNKRIFDDSKISDHFAIIPTLQRPKSLSELETKLYDLVVKRFLAVFYPPAEYLLTTRITRVAGEPFKTEGKVLVSPGWLAVYGKEAQGDDEATLAPVRQDEKVATEEIKVVASQTRPPPRFSEATLLSAMEGAGKLIEDDELREAMREKGLGTPATRAQIIEGLIQEKYVLREGRELQPTAKAFSLMTLLHGLGVPELFSPELTAEWEFKLAQMEHGKLKREQFMREIVKITKHIVAQAKNFESDTIPGDFATLGGALSEVRRRGARELQEVPVPVVRLRHVEDRRRPAARDSRSGEPVDRAQGRSARWLPQQARPAVFGELETQRRQRSAVRFRRRDRRRRGRRSARFQRSGSAGHLPEMRLARVRAARGVRVRKSGGRRTRPAIFVPAASSCSGRSRASR